MFDIHIENMFWRVKMNNEEQLLINRLNHKVNQQERTISQLVQIVATTNRKIIELQDKLRQLEKHQIKI